MTLDPEKQGNIPQIPIEELGHWRLGAIIAHRQQVPDGATYGDYDSKELLEAFEASAPQDFSERTGRITPEKQWPASDFYTPQSRDESFPEYESGQY